MDEWSTCHCAMPNGKLTSMQRKEDLYYMYMYILYTKSHRTCWYTCITIFNVFVKQVSVLLLTNIVSSDEIPKEDTGKSP